MVLALVCVAATLLAAAPPAVRKGAKRRIRVPAAKPYVPQPSPLDRKVLDALACASPENAGGSIGLYAVELETGKVILNQNARHAMTPASNTKVVSTALALARLGPQHMFETKLASDVEPDANGVLRGNLYWVGGGDPTLASRRFAALQENGATPAEALDAFVNAVVERGIRHITGDIVGDDTHFPRDPYPIGWTVDDTIADYGAPVSALTFHENTQALTISPDGVAVWPRADYYTLVHQVKPGETTDIQIDREGRQLLLSGTLRADRTTEELVAIDEPALFAAAVLKEALEARGIRVDGSAVARSRRNGDPRPDPPAVTLFTRKSPPLVEILKVIDKFSHNLFAELVLRETARVRTGEGSRQAGIREMTQFLVDVGADPGCCYFQDGSGLSRQTLVTAEALAKVLAYMYQSEHRDAWVGLMPIGGVDGSLRRRFADAKEAGARIRAKTGSLAHVATLSGYALQTKRGDIAFSILFNHYNGSGAEARAIIDKIAVAIGE